MDNPGRTAPCFVEDIYPRQMLYALTIRSPIARGRLKSLECPRLPNIYTLITAADIPGKNRLEDSQLPILAEDTLSYIGEPAALLVGPDKTMLEEYAAQIKIIAEEDEPVFSCRNPTESMILAKRSIRIGEPEAAFEQAAKIVQDDYSTGIQEHWYAEPIGAVSWFEQNNAEAGNQEKTGKTPGKILVARTATQWPFHVKRSLCQALKLDPAAVRVEPTIVGLHMDGKLWYPSLIACHAALGTLITKKPVRMILTREEDFHYSPKRCGTEIHICSALDEKGKILGTEINVSVNLGAYGVNGEEMLDQTCLGSLGIYQFDKLKLSGEAIRTNIPPQGPFAGFGLSQGFFALERHISHIADLHKEDPAEWRKKNFPVSGGLPLGPASKESAPCGELLDTAAAMSGYYRKWAAYELLRQSRRKEVEKGESLRGIGVAIGYQGNGLLYPGTGRGSFGIEVTLGKDGNLEIKTSMVSTDDDYSRVWANMAAEILAIEPGMVHIVNSGEAPDSGPACASRNITVLTKLMEKCCLAIRKQRFRDPLPITVRRAIRAQSSAASSMLWEERPQGIDWGAFAKPGWAAAVVEVEIDSVEYIPKIRGVWISIDGGKILDQNRARRSLKVSAIQALGWAFREHISYTEGTLSQTQFENYNIPSPSDIPPINIDFLWNDSGEPRGIGELPFNCIPAAYLQAVSQAMDHHFQSIPLKRDDIWEAGKLKKTENPVP
ncbi:aldehyde oxidase [Spirochaetia bacterium]|nr:aldehyde oxidase [Spirochaetia bacterium]